MELEHMEIARLELKYCERCGALWLRQRGIGIVYCAACASETSDFPFLRRRVSRLRLAINDPTDIESQGGTDGGDGEIGSDARGRI